MSSKTMLRISSEVGAACPALKRVLWMDGSAALLERDGAGEVVEVKKCGTRKG